MNAVIYDPSDGRILSTVQATEANIKAGGLPYIAVDHARDDYSETHRVVDGKLQPIEDAQ